MTTPRVVHVIPHRLSLTPEGHVSRHAALLEVLPGLRLGWTAAGAWDTALVESGAPVPSATRVIAIAKSTNHPVREIVADATVPIGPYEGIAGSVGPLVRVAPKRELDTDLLLVPSWGQNYRWFHGLPGIPGGWLDMPRAEIVICAGGSSLYEALWSGCRVVCLPQGREQETRARFAAAAGESVVVVLDSASLPGAIKKAQKMRSLGRRDTGAKNLARMVLG